MEVAAGIHRLEFNVGTKRIAMHLLVGDGLILVDSGLQQTPEDVYVPAIRELGYRPEDVRILIITHADADHIGGNATCRRLFPHVQIACHTRDQRWASDPAVITTERYDGFYSDHGLRYDQEVFDMLSSWMGPAEPMDILLQGGERIRRADDDWLNIYHVPGHTPGHICLHNPIQRYAIIGDAIFGRSQLDTAGSWSAPPPYTDVSSYRGTIQTIAALDVDMLLTCHYPVMHGETIRDFVDASRQFVDLAEAITRQLLQESKEPLTLREAVTRANPLLGPFAFPDDLQFALLAHLEHAEEMHQAKRGRDKGGTVTWTWCG